MSRARLAVALCAALLAGCASARYPQPERRAALIEVPTADGWTIALHHFPPARGAPARRHPVILCHGIMSNRFTWDLDADVSLATWLARRGFDVYALDLRGGGEALRPGWFDPQGYTYRFDDYVAHDVPAALAAVSARAGGRPVHWVGHSMGGMVMYAWLQGGEQARVRSFTAVGSPPLLSDHIPAMTASMKLLPIAELFFDELPTGTLSTLGAAWADQDAIAPLHILWNPDNLGPGAARRLAAHGTANLSAGVLRQLVDSAEAGRLQSADGAVDYTAGLAKLRAPVLFIAGVLDHLAPPTTVMQGFRLAGSPIKRIAVMGRAHGQRRDYGHLDLAMGAAAPDEVFPVIPDWLVARD
ncbi:MAG: alpha/beta fold hydrolase [Myxococcales bacterium]|nr:alpha/beta fold hydrolase [Myxococcales bacterium]